MIFSHQDVPSFVGKSCQDVPSLGRKNQWVRSCLSMSMLLQCSQLQNGTSYSSVLMIFSHQDVPSFVGKSCQDVPSLVRKISGYVAVYQYQCYYGVRSFKAVQALALYS